MIYSKNNFKFMTEKGATLYELYIDNYIGELYDYSDNTVSLYDLENFAKDLLKFVEEQTRNEVSEL